MKERYIPIDKALAAIETDLLPGGRILAAEKTFRLTANGVEAE